MKSIVKTGKTVDDAVAQALDALNATLDDVSIEVIEEPKAGLFGMFGAKDAAVRVTRKESSEFRELLRAEGILGDEKVKIEDVAPEPVRCKVIDRPVEEKAAPKTPIQKGSFALKKKTEKVIVKTSDMRPEETNAQPATEETTDVEKPVGEKAVEEKPVGEKQVEEKPLVAAQADIPESVEDVSDSVEEMPAGEIPADETSADEVQESEPEIQLPERETLSSEEALLFSKDWLATTLDMMHIQAKIQTKADGEDLYLELVDITDTDMGIVIGRRAETLNAIQYLLGVALNRVSRRHYRVYLDVGGYRKRRTQNITRLAARSAEKVVKYKSSVRLEPMNAYERRIVHTALQGVAHIETISEGREPHRRVVILYKA